MEGKGLMTIQIGALPVQDSCILGLVFQWRAGGKLDLHTLDPWGNQPAPSDGLAEVGDPIPNAPPPKATLVPPRGNPPTPWGGLARVGNLSPDPALMNQPVPTTSRSENPALSQQHTNQDTCATVDVVWRRSCEDFSLEQKVQLQFQDLFATKSEGMGQTLLLQHTIDTGDAPPIWLWPPSATPSPTGGYRADPDRDAGGWSH